MPLRNIQKELQLYQQECKLYQQLLRVIEVPPQRVETLQVHLRQTSKETLPQLQKALRFYEGQNANVTTADNGQSHMSYFLDQLHTVRSQIMALKYEVFDILYQHPVKPRIW